MAIRKKFSRGDIIQVEWGDAWGSGGWYRTKDKDCVPHNVTCIGAVVHINKKGIMLTSGFARDEQNLGEVFIPWGMVAFTKLLIPKSRIKTHSY